MNIFKNSVLALAAMAALAAFSTPAMAAEALFGRDAVASQDMSAFNKWEGVVARQNAAAATADTRAYEEFIASLRGQSRDAQIEAVNSYANRITYVADDANYGKNDHWATTAEFFARGGDCEDYAFAKFVALRLLGVPARDMKIVILMDSIKNERHAVLAVQHEGSTLILDNQNSAVLKAAQIEHYKPIYAITQNNWWRFI